MNNQVTVLILEDDLLVRAVIADHLRTSGFNVVEAGTGEDALASLESCIGVLFTDINLGGQLTGWDVADVFRASKPGIPIIYTSGYPPNNRRVVAGSLFFPKPYLPSAISDACERLAA